MDFIDKYKSDGSNYNDGSNTILLLDAFDEDVNAIEDYEKRLNEIIINTKTYRKVILSSRTHFFPEESKEQFSYRIPMDGTKKGYREMIKKYIAPFSDEEIKLFLKNKYGFKIKILNRTFYLNKKRKKAEKIAQKVINLVARPMLLDKIDLILDSNIKITNEKDIYEALIIEWVKRESNKQPNRTSNSFYQEMMEFLEQAALCIYNNFRQKKGLYIFDDQLEKIAQNKNITLDKLDLTSRSLLNRNPGGQFKFSHKSILEYLLAQIDLKATFTTNFINYETFDFGLTLRNQIIIEYIQKMNSEIYISYGDNKYYKLDFILNKQYIDKYYDITHIIAFNFKIEDAKLFRIFPNLKELTINETKQIIKESFYRIKINNKASFIGLIRHIIVHDKSKYSFKIKKLRHQEYFNKNNIEINQIVNFVSYNDEETKSQQQLIK